MWSQQTGKPVEFLADDWAGTLEALKDGRADVHSGLFINDERAEWLSFSQPIHEIKTSLFFREERSSDMTLNSFAGKKVGTIEGTYQHNWLINNNKKVQIVSYPNGREMILALLKKEISAVLNENVSVEADLASFGLRGLLNKSTQTTFSNPVVAAVRKDRQELISTINEGFDALSIEKLSKLEQQWLVNSDNRYYEQLLWETQFTSEEETWIRKNPAVTVAVTNYLNPMDILESDGSYNGLNSEFLSLLSKMTGLKFVPVFKPKWSDVVQAIMSGDTDIALTLSRTAEREKTISFTDPYAFHPQVIVVRRDYRGVSKWTDLSDKRIAVTRKAAIIEDLNKIITEKGALILTKNVEASVERLNNGEADAFVAGWVRYRDLEKAGQTKTLKIAAQHVSEGGALRVGIHKSNPLLANILNKGMKRIRYQELIDLRERWFSMESHGGAELTITETEWIKQHGKSIIVGAEMNWPPFDFVKNGNPTGFSNELLRLAAEKADLPIDTVSGFTWAELMEKFKNGNIDVLPAVYKTPDREKQMAFTEYYAANPSVIVCREKNSNIISMKNLVGKKLAVIKEFSINKVIQDLHPQIVQVPFKNVLEALKAVSLGKADGYVGSLGVISHLLKENLIPDIRVVDEVSLKDPEATHLHIAVKKDQTILRDIIQKGLDAISESELNQLRRTWLGLGEGYVSQDHKKDLYLTEEEKQWLKTHKTIRLGVDPSWLPFEGVGSDGLYMGIVSEYVDWINKKLGVSMSPVEGLSWEEVISEAKTGGVDVLPGVGVTPSRQVYLNFTQPYIKIPMMLVIREDMPFVSGLEGLAGKRVAIIKNAPMGEKLRDEHPDMDYLETKTLVDALQAVENGDADATLGNHASLTYYVRRDDIRGLKIVAALPETLDLSIGIRKDWPQLVSILNKVLSAIPDREHRSFQDRWVNIQVESRIDWRPIWKVGLTILLLGGMIFFFILRANRKLAREIVDRKAAQDKLRKSEAHFRNILATAAEGFWHVDNETITVDVNDAMCEIMGRTREEAVGQPISDFLDKENWNIVLKQMEHRERGEFGSYELVITRPDGSTVPALLHASPVFDVEGVKIGSIAMVSDITERKKAEKSIKDNEKRVQTILNSISTAILIIDPENRTIVDINPVAAKMIGLDPKDIIGEICHQFICPNKNKDCPILDHDHPIDNAERILLTAEGRQIPVLKTVVPVILGGRKFLLESFVDLSEQKKVEEELRTNLDELERFNRITVKRELKMIELKQEINDLIEKSGQTPKYKIV